MNPRTAQRLAWLTALLAGVLVGTGLILSILAFMGSNGRLHLAPHQVFNPLITLSFSFVGALIASRHPRNPIGWMLGMTGFLSGLDLLALGYNLYSSMMNDPLPGAGLANWLDHWLWILPVGVPMTFLLQLFPDGRLVSPRWLLIAWLAGLGLATAILGSAIDYWLITPGGRNPAQVALLASAANVIESGAWVFLTIGVVGSLASLLVRFRQSRGVERDRLKWLVYAVGLGLALGVLGNTVPMAAGMSEPIELAIISTDVGLVAIIVAVGIAIIRHQLYDINLLINRTLVYGTLTALIAAIYVLVVGSLGALIQVRGSLSISLLATGLVAISFQPMRDRLQRGANRLMYGERDDPYTVLSRLSRHLEATLAPEAVLPTIVETVAQTLKLPYVAILVREPDAFRTAAFYGQPAREAATLLLHYHGETVGQLICAPRHPGELFTAGEQQLLQDIAHQAGVAVHALRLTVDLQHSRARLVTAREEERRHLRRDLHDGLGPSLAALHLQAGTLRRLIRKEPEAAERMVDDLKLELKALIDDIRQLAYGLRPPALDELGLVGAIQNRAGQISQGDNREEDSAEQRERHDCHVQIQASGDLQWLPAAVEVAAYHIVQEALLNVMRHAQASRCTVRLERAKNLSLEVIDNGKGLAPQHHAGVGILSMRERAAELGGWCSVEPRPAGGTVVHAQLPVLES